MEDFDLSPDELIAKTFRIIQVLALAITRTARANGLLR
jgi:hypothetical protein